MIEILYPLYFLFLIPILIILIFRYFKWWKKIHFWPIDDLKKVYKYNSIFYKFYFILIFFIFTFYLAIFSKPVNVESVEPDMKNGIDIQIVLDLSYSMLAEDMKPNRITVAKEVINNFLNNIVSDRIWIVVFAWKTFTSLPLNFDYDIVKKVVDKIAVDTINQNFRYMQWTAMWDALILATDTFSEDDREKVIILLTDWEANKWIDPIIALRYLRTKNENIKVYTIWLGWDKDTFVKVKNHFWTYDHLPIWWVDEKTLKEIANTTWWIYFRAWNKESLQKIFTTINELEKREIELDDIKVITEDYSYIVYLLVLFFTMFILIKYFKRI